MEGRVYTFRQDNSCSLPASPVHPHQCSRVTNEMGLLSAGMAPWGQGPNKDTGFVGQGQGKALLLRTGTWDVHDDGLGPPAEGQGWACPLR